jgi:hypothetical protein
VSDGQSDVPGIALHLEGTAAACESPREQTKTFVKGMAKCNIIKDWKAHLTHHNKVFLRMLLIYRNYSAMRQ